MTLWILFSVVVVLMLAIDLGLFHRKPHEIAMREALLWSAVWITIGTSFTFFVHFWRGPELALQYITAYLIEKSLSVDNIFVFLVIFSYFGIPPRLQHRVLYWGILGAVVMRAVLIGAGVVAIERFHWLSYVLGAVLVFTGVRLLLNRERHLDPGKNPVLRFCRRFLRVAEHSSSDHFFIKQNGKWFGTQLLVVLLVVESTDLVFALDSIPAVLAITHDPMVAFTSNIFAILGLRALYFALASVLPRLRYLQYGLALVLVLIGLKMAGAQIYRPPVAVTLGVVAGILAVTTLFSLRKSAGDTTTPAD